MTRHALAVSVSVLLAGSAAAAQSLVPPNSGKPKEMAVTGCLIQGATPDLLLLDDARFNPQNKDEKTRTYVIVAGVPDLPLRAFLNKEVRITGEAPLKSDDAAGPKTPERDLPKISARSIAPVADRCTVVTP